MRKFDITMLLSAQISNYGQLGHAKVVRLQIPSLLFPQFVKKAFSIVQRDRRDQWDIETSHHDFL